MRFNSNAFVVSTVALLSLITPVVNAQTVATFTEPAGGESFNVSQSVLVKWTVNDPTVGPADCSIALLHNSGDPNVSPSPSILQSNVPLQNGESNGPVTIPRVESGDSYFMQLLTADQSFVFAQSNPFSIVNKTFTSDVLERGL
ncbi:hypothetical protein BGY98DRAFT_421868 [Russula aff. rugulosa BPL654]|nr:hypothetical protein BGY98DRAFT_421868 [Russula aff. rugulosa BPL654]